MIVLSVGLPKSGTAWYYNMTNDLLVSVGHQNAREIREKFHLHFTLKHENCFWIGSPWRRSLVLIPHFLGSTFAIKSHGPPSVMVRLLMRTGVMKLTYVYRDPRDCVISVFDSGQKRLQSGLPAPGVESIEASIRFIHNWLVPLSEWLEDDNVLKTRYEGLLRDPVCELKRLATFLELAPSTEALSRIASAYQPQHFSDLSPEKRALHFNKGTVGRFRDRMTLQELDSCQKYFGDYLQKMGYSA